MEKNIVKSINKIKYENTFINSSRKKKTIKNEIKIEKEEILNRNWRNESIQS